MDGSFLLSQDNQTVAVNYNFDPWDGTTLSAAGKDASGDYLIYNAENLAWFAVQVNTGNTGIRAILMQDIDLGGKTWTPIGTSALPFGGTLDGNRHTISGLNPDGSSDCTGLIGYAAGVTVKDLTLCGSVDGSNIAAALIGQISGGYNSINSCTNHAAVTSEGGVAAGLVGQLQTGAERDMLSIFVTNCVNDADMTAEFGNATGFVGSMYSGGYTAIFENDVNKGKLSGGLSAVGIAYSGGSFQSFTIANCKNVGTLKSESSNAVGIADSINSNVYSSVTGCTNKGDITGSGSLAGICDGALTIKDCVNTGDITGQNGYSAGIAYYAGETAISNCRNTGNVTGGVGVGGIAGGLAPSNFGRASVTRCSNTGNVTGSGDVGGLTGMCSIDTIAGTSIVTGCYSTGKVTAISTDTSSDGKIGGLIGEADAYNGSTLIIENCFATGDVDASAVATAGGLIGCAQTSRSSSSLRLQHCYSASSVSASQQAGGLIGLLSTNKGNVGPVTVTNCYSAAASVASTDTATGGSGIGQITNFDSTSELLFSNVFALTFGHEKTVGSSDNPVLDANDIVARSAVQMGDPAFVTLLGGAFSRWSQSISAGTDDEIAACQALYGSYAYPVLRTLCGSTPTKTCNVKFIGAQYVNVTVNNIDTYATTVAHGGAASFTLTNLYPDYVTINSVSANGQTLTPHNGTYTLDGIGTDAVVTVAATGTPPQTSTNNTVTFNVTGADGKAISGVTVDVTGQTANGDCSYSLDPGTYTVTVSKTSYKNVTGTFTVSASGTVNVTLYPDDAQNYSIALSTSSGYYIDICNGDILIGSTKSTTTVDGSGYCTATFSLPAGSYSYRAIGTSSSYTGSCLGSGPLKVKGDAAVRLRLVNFAGNLYNRDNMNYTMTVNSSDGTVYFPGSTSKDGGVARGCFVLPTAERGIEYRYAFLPVNSAYWGSAGVMYLYNSMSAQTFTGMNLSDGGQFVIIKATSVTITIPKDASLRLYHRVKFYQPLEELTAKSTNSNGDGTTTYTYDAPSATTLHYELELPGYVKKAYAFTTNKTASTPTIINVTMSSMVIDTGKDIPGNSPENNSDILMNAPDSKYITLQSGQQFDLSLFRVWQAIDGITSNNYVDPDYKIEVVSGDSVQITDPYYAGATVKAVDGKSGVSIVRVTYGALDYSLDSGGDTLYSKLWEKNTVYLAFNVNPKGSAAINTGITQTEFDTEYFTRSINGVTLPADSQYSTYTFKPTVTGSTLADVAIHAPVASTATWDDTAWTSITANEDGSYTAKLTEGRSLVRVTAADGTVSCYSLRAAAVDETVTGSNVRVSVQNGKFKVTASGNSRLSVSYSGLAMPFAKLGAITNPGYPDGTYLIGTLTSPTGGTSSLETAHGQYGLSTAVFSIPLAGTGDYTISGGKIRSTSAYGAGPSGARGITKGGNTGGQSTYVPTPNASDYVSDAVSPEVGAVYAFPSLPSLTVKVLTDVQNVISLIDTIGTVDATSGSAITAARSAYNALESGKQTQVTNYNALIAAESKYALLKTKATAKASLDTYKNPNDYREAQKAELTEAITAGKTAIEQAENEAAVSTALQQAKAAIDQIKTDAQLTKEEHPAKSVWQMILEFLERVYNFLKNLFSGLL